MENSPEKRDDSVITECPVDKVADDSAYSQENDQNSVKYSVTSSGVVKDEKASCSPRSPNQTVPDFHLKREISNLSLSVTDRYFGHLTDKHTLNSVSKLQINANLWHKTAFFSF